MRPRGCATTRGLWRDPARQSVFWRQRFASRYRQRSHRLLCSFRPMSRQRSLRRSMASLPESGLGNPVAGVLFVYRALDTLLEKVVLLLALIGVWSLAPDRLWGGVPELRPYAQPSGALTFLAQVAAANRDRRGFLYVLGWRQPPRWCLSRRRGPGGHVAPGRSRGLAGLALDQAAWMRVLLVAGPVVFLAIGFAGFVLADAFLAYPKGYAKPLIVVVEVTLTAFDRRDARPAGGRPAGADPAPMSAATLFGVCAAALVGLGLFGLITDPRPLRKILAFNILGGGVFLFFGMIARRARRPVSAAIRCRMRWSSRELSSPSRQPQWRSRCCCGSSRKPVKPRLLPTILMIHVRIEKLSDAECGDPDDNSRRVSARAGDHDPGCGDLVVAAARRALGRTRRLSSCCRPDSASRPQCSRLSGKAAIPWFMSSEGGARRLASRCARTVSRRR